jgi:hypothetical protein
MRLTTFIFILKNLYLYKYLQALDKSCGFVILLSINVVQHFNTSEVVLLGC